MKSTYIAAATPLRVILPLLLRNGISPSLPFIGRAIFLLQSGFFATLLELREQRLFQRKLSQIQTPSDPLIIVGHWRTGSTFLHQILSSDPQLTAPTLYQCCFPTSFLSARPFVQPILSPATKGKRPMDNVQVNMDSPHEDEDALFRMTGISPLRKMLFPEQSKYFLLGDTTFMPDSAAQSAAWEHALKLFTKKIFFQTGKKLVLKNPFHSLRIPLLKKAFPQARFINILRDPHKVIPSTVHMWSIVGKDNSLKKNWCAPSIDTAITVFDHITETVHRDLSDLPCSSVYQIRFEELEQDPLHHIQNMYKHFDMQFSEITRSPMEQFLTSVSRYTKNNHTIGSEDRQCISDRLDTYMKRYGYTGK